MTEKLNIAGRIEHIFMENDAKICVLPQKLLDASGDEWYNTSIDG